jgi:hypothetical protein
MYYSVASSYRYFYWTKCHPDIRGRKLRYGTPEWKKIVRGDKYNEEEFLKLFRVPCKCFDALVRLLKHHAAFSKHGLKQRKHFSVELHLLVVWKYFGSKGNAGSTLSVKQGLGIAKGSVMNYLRRGVDAILFLFPDTVILPDEKECNQISCRIIDTHERRTHVRQRCFQVTPIYVRDTAGVHHYVIRTVNRMYGAILLLLWTLLPLAL